MDAYVTSDAGSDGENFPPVEIILASCGRPRRSEIDEGDEINLAYCNAHCEHYSKASTVLWGISRMRPQSTIDENGASITS